MKHTCKIKVTSLRTWSIAMMIGGMAAGPLTGCKKWLNATPQDKVPQVVLFTNEQGFKDALTGVYLAMDKPNAGGTNGLYTNDLSMGILSVMAYDYDNAGGALVGGNSMFQSAFSYNYNNADLKAEIANIWSGLYNNIANVNNILSQVDAAKGLFSADNYQRVKGEALGLRALFHFDAVRLFGEPPITAGSTPAVPYIRKFTISQTPLSTVNQALDSCIADLDAARALLATTDTSVIQGAILDPFTSYTQNHMNYWAVTGLMARVFLYGGHTDSAAYYASTVIGSGKFPLIQKNVAYVNSSPRDRTFSQEQLFSVYSQTLGTSAMMIFGELASGSGTPLDLSTTGKNNMYAVPVADNTDWRMASWYDQTPGASNATLVPSKFFQDATLPYNLQGLMPVIRVSEMYYIAAECANDGGDIPTGVSYINAIRLARGLKALTVSGITTADSVNHLIRNEYRKEFNQEGQAFFYYKRLNLNLNTFAGTTAILPSDPFTFPLPDAEKQYRGM